jgi:hypothetical protein
MIKEIWDSSCIFHTVSQMIVQTVMIPLPPSLVLLRAVISPCLHELSALLHVLCAVPCFVQVPISLVYRKELAKKNGSTHMLLHGYGSYEYAYDPRFV